MCGILIALNPSEERVKSISHRGIEHGQIDTPCGLSLVHHRLPIQTAEGDNWKQPIDLGDDRYLLFNGEIFNYPENFSSDTEYLQSLFSSFDFSPEMFIALYVPHINSWDGFWAICLVNGRTGDIISFTDPLGKKCLYYNEKGEICSEMKGLFDSHPLIDMSFIGGVNKWGYIPNESTPFLGITKMKNNHIYKWNYRSPDIRFVYGPYYRFNFNFSRFNSEDDAYDWLWNKVELATKNRLLSLDYPISILLSGGLDSSIIGGMLLKLGADVNWYTINNGEDNEYVKKCEEYWGIKVNNLDYFMNTDDADFQNKLKEIYLQWNESPVDLGSVIPQYMLFDAVKKGTNTRIVLSGDGADELFGGYKRIDQFDSQDSDIFHELTYYHLPRLDKMSMAHTLELRNPFLNLEIVSFARSLPIEYRKHKKVLKETFKGLVPESIIARPKFALKNEKIVQDPLEYRKTAINLFLQAYLEKYPS